MNFDEAIATHAEWKLRLHACLSEPARCGLNPDEIEREDGCDLGRWIHNGGSAFAGEPGFQALREQHRRFHQLAADIVRSAQSGNLLEAEALLVGEYLRRSGAVIGAILEMKQRAERDGA